MDQSSSTSAGPATLISRSRRILPDDGNLPELQNAETFVGLQHAPEFNDIIESRYPTVVQAPTSDEKDVLTNTTSIEQGTGGICTSKKSFWRRKVLRCPVWLLAVICIIITGSTAIGLGVGISLRMKGIKVNHDANHTVGLSAIDSGNITDRSMTLFAGASPDQIRRAVFRNNMWTGHADGDIVAEDLVGGKIRAGSPLMAVTYIDGDEKIWRVFYVDKSDTLQEVLTSNKTQGWWSGSLGASRYAFSTSPHAGISVCTSSYYGDGLGLRLYFGARTGNIRELRWQQGDNAWETGFTFPDSNAHGGVECTTRGMSTTYVWMLNTSGALQQWWYDFNSSAALATHHTEEWIKGITQPNVAANTSIAAIQVNNTRYVHFQVPDSTIVQLATTGEAENMTWSTTSPIGPGLPGTHLTAVVLATEFGGAEVHVIAEKPDRAVTDFTRTLEGGTWNGTYILGIH